MTDNSKNESKKIVSHDQNFKNLIVDYPFSGPGFSQLNLDSAGEGLIELEADPKKRIKYFEFIDLYAGLNDEETARYRDAYLKNRPHPAGRAAEHPV